MLFHLGPRVFGPGDVALMGVVNATPDSFSDGGRFQEPLRAIEHGLRLWHDGADVLDVGGESTRPGAAPVSLDEELRRVLPVVEGLAAAGATVSVDTTKAEVARRACEAGAVMVNDVSGLRFDPALAEVTAAAGASLCVMHMQGEPRTMQKAPHYEDVLADVGAFLRDAVDRAVRIGVAEERILIDPGIGFGKTQDHNLALIRGCELLTERVGRPVLMGVSRKRFLGRLTGRDVHQREFATAGAVAACVIHGARMVRVHDVAAIRDVIIVLQACIGT